MNLHARVDQWQSPKDASKLYVLCMIKAYALESLPLWL